MLLKEVFLYQMKHIAIILISTILFCSMSIVQVCGVSLVQALNQKTEIQSEQEDSLIDDMIERKKTEFVRQQLNDVRSKIDAILEQKRLQERKAEIGAAIESAAYSTPSTRAGHCAGWISNVYSNAGFGDVDGNADDMYYRWCDSSDTSQIAEGMIIAVPTHGNSRAGRIYGHVGVIVQHDDGSFWVLHSTGIIEEDTLSEWIEFYSDLCYPSWGFANDVF